MTHTQTETGRLDIDIGGWAGRKGYFESQNDRNRDLGKEEM